MRRRELIALIAGAALGGPRAALAQAPKVPRIGVLVAGKPDPGPLRRILVQALQDLGYVEGKTIRIDFRSAEGETKRLGDLAADLVAERVDIIIAWQTPVVQAAKRATSEIPIVMADAGDPVGTGFVASLAHPGGNITGMSGVTAQLAGKSVELIKEMLPKARLIAALCNAPDPFSRPFLAEIQQAALSAGVEIRPVMVSGDQELESAFERMSDADAVIVQPSLPTRRAAELALGKHLPAASVPRWFAEEGGLLSYSPRMADIYREAAGYVDKILKGAKPADLPVQQPTKFELVFNLKTAKALGLIVPPTLLARADEVIE